MRSSFGSVRGFARALGFAGFVFASIAGCGDDATPGGGGGSDAGVLEDGEVPRVDAGRNNGIPDSGQGPMCGTRVCRATEICVNERTVGGARVVPDGSGNCPTGMHVEGDHCAADWMQRCDTRPICTGDPGCGCYAIACAAQYTMCVGATFEEVRCEQQAP